MSTASVGLPKASLSMWSFYLIVSMIFTSHAAMIAVSSSHSCAALTSSKMQCWGYNYYGQLGDGTSVDKSTPKTVSSVTSIAAIDAADSNTCALATGGTVKCWGSNSYGQVGDGTFVDRTSAVSVPTISDASVISVGGQHSCVKRTDGTVKCWGSNYGGRQGDGNLPYKSIPTTVSSISTAVSIAGGSLYTCALLIDGTVKCWGYNGNGQLGDGTTIDRTSPVTVSGLSDVISLYGCDKAMFAITSSGGIKAWGGNSGLLGDGTTTDRKTPVTVLSISNAVSVVIGSLHACALLIDGTAKCWGYNADGEIGDGTTTPSYSPKSVSSLSEATALSAGNYFTCALISDGTIKCWGLNSNGMIGDGTIVSKSEATAVSSISTATAIVTAAQYACALLADNTVRCWGYNGNGQLGDGTQSTRKSPVIVSSLTDVVSLSAHDSSACAKLNDGTLRCWGLKGYGILGNNTAGISVSPVTVSSISTAIAIGAGGYHVCVVLSDGTVKCWGQNGKGQLGDGTTVDKSVPVSASLVGTATALALGNGHTCALLLTGTVSCWGDSYSSIVSGASTITSATFIAAGYQHTCALISDGTVKCWGANTKGQLGDGTTVSGTKTVLSVNDAIAIATGAYHSCALKSDGTAVCWGDNYYFQLGGNTNNQQEYLPVAVASLTGASLIATGWYFTCAGVFSRVQCWGQTDYYQHGNSTTYNSSAVTAMSAGFVHACVLSSAGGVQCWGTNTNGQLGDGTTTSRVTPLSVPFDTTVLAIASGSFHSCALLADGTVQCWGNNAYGQMGIGQLSVSATPVTVASSNESVSSVDAGKQFRCALLIDSSVNCWGYNDLGQLGDGSFTNRYTAVSVATLSNDVISIFTGESHACALKTDRTIKCWGSNSRGQLGDGSLTLIMSTPTTVSSLTSVNGISAGYAHTCVVLTDSTVQCWGSNTYGQLGDGTAITRYSPTMVTSLSGVSAISLGTYHSCALLLTGKVKCWGSNQNGQLGDETFTTRYSPVEVSTLSAVINIAAGWALTCGIVSGNNAYCWGNNYYGQLGDATVLNRNYPVSVSIISDLTSIAPGSGHTCGLLANEHVVCWGGNWAGQLGNGTTKDSKTSVVYAIHLPNTTPTSQPSRQPTSQPSRQPSRQPTRQPVGDPTSRPSQQPSSRPTSQPFLQPSSRPTTQPTRNPSMQPSSQPSSRPSQPSSQPTNQPTGQPWSRPSSLPTSQPSCQPSLQPSNRPSTQPSHQPTIQPSLSPSSQPSLYPSSHPSSYPSTQPSQQPSELPSGQPSGTPTMSPSIQPTQSPTTQPTDKPSIQPSRSPSSQPTLPPTTQPSNQPWCLPSGQPSTAPTGCPSNQPTTQPSVVPSCQPYSFPTTLPSVQPTVYPTGQPSQRPSTPPSRQPLACPTGQPTTTPSVQSVSWPTCQPSSQPSTQPSRQPTTQPTVPPTNQPSISPTDQPTRYPTSIPSLPPSSQPSIQPTCMPTRQPSSQPTSNPSLQLFTLSTSVPTCKPPTSQPTSQPSLQRQPPSAMPTMATMVSTVDLAIIRAWEALVSNASTTTTFVDGPSIVSISIVKPSVNASGSSNVTNFSVVLPGSGTSVNIVGLSTSSATALVVTTVEVEANRFATFASKNTSVNTTGVTLPAPTLVSGVVTIQVSKLLANGSLQATALPYFETNVAVIANNNSNDISSFLKHNCTLGVVETVSIFCEDTALRLNLTCTGRTAAIVHRQCPVSRAVCSVVDLASNRIVSNDYCRTIDLGTSVFCQCGGTGSNSGNVSAIVSSGRVSVGVFQVYGAGSFTASVALATTLSASDVAAKSVMMLSVFGCVWGIGLILLFFATQQISFSNVNYSLLSPFTKASSKGIQPLETSHQTVSPTTMQQETSRHNLLRSVLPCFFRFPTAMQTPTSSNCVAWLWKPTKWWWVWSSCHPYARIIRILVWHPYRRQRSQETSVVTNVKTTETLNYDGNDSSSAPHDVILDVIHALTAVTLACFLLAMLYDYQYPEDDGFCATLTTEAACTSRKMLLDPFQSRCLWHPSSSSAPSDEDVPLIQQIVNGVIVDTERIHITTTGDYDESPSCLFNGSNNSTTAFMLSYIITSLFASVLNVCLVRFMVILSARQKPLNEIPVQNFEKETIKEHDSQRQARFQRQRLAALKEATAIRMYPMGVVTHYRQTLQTTFGSSCEAVIDCDLIQRHPRRNALRSAESTMVDSEQATNVKITPSTTVEASTVRHLLRTASSVDYAVILLRLALADVIDSHHGYQHSASRRVYLMTLYRAFPSVASLRYLWYWQVLVVGLLVVCNAGALYFLVSKAAVRGYGWQISFLKIAAVEWVSDVVLLQSLEIALFDYLLCALVQRDVEKAIATLLNTNFKISKPNDIASEPHESRETHWISLEMCRQWPGLLESRWIEASTRLWSSYLIMESSVTIRCLSSQWWIKWLARASFDAWETIVAFGAPLVFAWLLYVYYTYVAGAVRVLSPLERAMIITIVVVVIVVVLVWWLWSYRPGSVNTLNALPVVAMVDIGKEPNDGDNMSLQWSTSSSMEDEISAEFRSQWGDADSCNDDNSNSDSQQSDHSQWRWSDEHASSVVNSTSRSFVDEHKINDTNHMFSYDDDNNDEERSDSALYWAIDSQEQEYKPDIGMTEEW